MIDNELQRKSRDSRVDSINRDRLRQCLEGWAYLPEANILPPIFKLQSSSTDTRSIATAEPLTLYVTKSSQAWRDFKLIRPENYMHSVELLLGSYAKVKAVLKKPQNIYSYSTPITFSEQSLRTGRQIAAWNNMQRELLSVTSQNRLTHLVSIDIQACYHTMYTHAIEWALEAAGYKTFGQNLDTSIRRGNKNRTHGLPVGQYLSDIIAEIVLSRVDVMIEEQLEELDCTGYRFRDNYYFLCKGDADAEQILSAVAVALRELHFTINEGKTSIVLFSEYYSSRWQNEFNLLIESLQINIDHPVFTNKKLNVFIEQTILLSKKHKNQKNILEKCIAILNKAEFSGYINFKSFFYVISSMLPLRTLSYPKILAFMKKLVDSNSPVLDDIFIIFMINEIEAASKRKDIFALLWLAYIAHDTRDPGLKEKISKALNAFSDGNALVTESLKYLESNHARPILWSDNRSRIAFTHRDYMDAPELTEYLGISFGES